MQPGAELVQLSRRSAWWLGFGAALTFYWTVATLGAGFPWVRHCRLALRSAQTEAVITATEPANHNAAAYEFEVEGRRYRSSGQGIGPVEIGDKVTVFYLPDDPTFSTTKSPSEDLAFMIVGPLLMSAFAGFVMRARVGKASRSKA